MRLDEHTSLFYFLCFIFFYFRSNRDEFFQDSVRTGFTNSSESVQVEEYADSTEETESESIRDKPVRTRHKSM